MTPEEIQAARALVEAATPGPWRLGDRVTEVWADRDAAGWDAFLILTTETRLNPDGPDDTADAEFIAAARTLVPRLLDALDEARAEQMADRAEWFERGFKGGEQRAEAAVVEARKAALHEAADAIVAECPEFPHGKGNVGRARFAAGWLRARARADAQGSTPPPAAPTCVSSDPCMWKRAT